MTSRLHVWITALTIAVACSAGCASASAAGWVDLGQVAPPGTPLLQGSAVGVDGDGNVWAVTTVASSSPGHILVFERRPGGMFNLVTDVARPNVLRSYLAVGSDGTVAVYWREGNPSAYEAMVRPPGGTFGAPQSIAAHANNTPSGVVQPDGTFVVAYTTGTPNNALYLATRTPGPAGTFTSVAVPGQGAGAKDNAPLMSLSPTGRAALVWTDGPPTAIRIAEIERPVGGPLGTLTPVATRSLQAGEMSQSLYPGALDVDAAGNVLVVFAKAVTTGMFTGTEALQASVRPAGSASFPAAQTLVSRPLGGFGLDLVSLHGAIDDAGDATAMWIDESTSASTLATATASAPGFSFPATPATVPTTTFGATGDALVALAGGGNAALAVARTPVALTRGHAAAWGAATELSTQTTANDAAIAADTHGNAYASWLTFPSTGDRTMSLAAYDATPPTVGSISGAGTAAAGTAVTLAVSPSDALSPTTVNWDFGDGTSGTGTSVSHVWAHGGSYTVRATAIDGGANSSTASTTQTIIAAGPDHTRPAITKAKLSRTRFAVGVGPTATSAKAKHKAKVKPRGTVIGYTLSETAAMTFTITHTTAGRRSGKTCHATKKFVAKKSRCKATVTDGKLRRAGKHGGANVVAFSGRIGHRALHHGAYRLALSAKDAAGNVSTSRTLTFTIY